LEVEDQEEPQDILVVVLEEILKFLVLVFQLLLKVVLEEDGGKLMFLQLVDLVAVDQVVVMVEQEHLVKELMVVLVKDLKVVLT
tara:strand:- start:254 stop:505 length:252 start_codon:yes stop_codon:yes gene_type:complete